MPTETAPSVVDLVVLGLLLDAPMNAYGLGTLTDKQQLARLVKLSKPAIYKSCLRLSAAGHLKGSSVRATEAPEKVVYELSPSGRAHFDRLMKFYSSQFIPFHFEFNSVVWNLARVSHAKGLTMLKDLESELLQARSWLVAHEKEERAHASFGTRMVIKQYRMVVTTLVQWIKEAIEEFSHPTTKPGHAGRREPK